MVKCDKELEYDICNYKFNSWHLTAVTHTKQLILVTLCDTTARIGKNESVTYVRTDRRMDVRQDRQT